ncbi:MAG: hypothetical protein ACJAVO_000624 [Parvibaculaceae bacterium]|jgi:hypothetical protein
MFDRWGMGWNLGPARLRGSAHNLKAGRVKKLIQWINFSDQASTGGARAQAAEVQIQPPQPTKSQTKQRLSVTIARPSLRSKPAVEAGRKQTDGKIGVKYDNDGKAGRASKHGCYS